MDRRAEGGRAPHQPTTPHTRKPEDSGAAHTQQIEPPSMFLLKFISKLSVVKVRAISWKQMESPPASCLCPTCTRLCLLFCLNWSTNMHDSWPRGQQIVCTKIKPFLFDLISFKCEERKKCGVDLQRNVWLVCDSI